MPRESKKTPLHGWHTAHNANMAVFGGYDMPLWYPSGAKAEHLSVLTNVGVFDTSHMAVVTVSGSGAFELLQYCFTKDLTACFGKDRVPGLPGRCVYGVFLNDRGEVIDDAIVYPLSRDDYMIVVNSGMGSQIARHLSEQARGLSVSIDDLTDKTGKMDVQGPMSPKVLMRVLAEPERVLKGMSYFTFKGHFDRTNPAVGEVRLIDGTPVLLSRTGYTGELGFEIFTDPNDILRAWEMIFDAGKDLGALPCGLAARDSLRAGAMLPLSHQDIGAWPFINNPWTFALPFTADKTGFTKKFLGAEALLNVRNPEYTYAFAGFDLRKVTTHDGQAVVLDSDGTEIGRVLTCVTDVSLGRSDGRIYGISSPDRPENFAPSGLSCGFVKVESRLEPGQVVELRDSRRKIKVAIVSDIRPGRTARRPISFD